LAVSCSGYQSEGFGKAIGKIVIFLSESGFAGFEDFQDCFLSESGFAGFEDFQDCYLFFSLI